VSNPQELTTFAVKTYRYLRLSIVVVVMSLMASVLIERAHVSCWQGSISAYYYTPVQAMLVGALFAIGVSMIAIKGSTDREDMLLNIAGVLAPIVAFVPTSPSSRACTSAPFIGGNTEAYINNNVLALAIGGGLAIVVTIGVALLTHKAELRRPDSGSIIGILLGVALLAVGLVWYAFFRDSFLERAHGGAAVVMFFIIWVVMVFNARSAESPYRNIYTATAAAMVLSTIAVVVGGLIDNGWRHQILWLEILQLGAFAVYWLAQTFEHWEGGVPTGEAR